MNDSCDIPEYCNGKSNKVTTQLLLFNIKTKCPEDIKYGNGVRCKHGVRAIFILNKINRHFATTVFVHQKIKFAKSRFQDVF